MEGNKNYAMSIEKKCRLKKNNLKYVHFMLHNLNLHETPALVDDT